MKCLICEGPLDNSDDDQICDMCEETRNELSDGKGDDEDE